MGPVAQTRIITPLTNLSVFFITVLYVFTYTSLRLHLFALMHGDEMSQSAQVCFTVLYCRIYFRLTKFSRITVLYENYHDDDSV